MKHSLVTALFLILPAARLAAVPDPFYQNLLRAGIQDYDRGDFASSAQTLRLACFGMLDEPPLLAACLSRLALAQDQAGDADGFQETFRRIAEIEERFQAYTRAALPAETRAALEQRLAARIPAATLRSIPAFQALADKKAQTPPSGRGSKKRGGGQPAASPPEESKTAAAPPSAPPPAVTPNTAPDTAPDTAEREKMAQVRRLLDQNSSAKELRQAFDFARQVADAHTASVEAQHLAAEAAYRISRWADAARYFRRGGEPAESQPELQFYMAVALFESGDTQGAAAILKRSLPNLQRTPYVDAYARKILG